MAVWGEPWRKYSFTFEKYFDIQANLHIHMSQVSNFEHCVWKKSQMSFLEAVLWSLSKIRRLVKIWDHLAHFYFLTACNKISNFESGFVRFNFWAIGVKRKKCQLWKRLCDQYQKFGGWWKFEANGLKNGQNSIFVL